MQANCRYGPATAYLYAYGLYAGDTGTVWGRSASNTWLYVNPDGIDYGCWVAASVVDVVGNIMELRVQQVRLPHSTLYGPPPWVKAVREGNQVIVTWGRVDMTEDDDRGYMIEANICLNGTLIWMPVHTNGTTYTFTDDTNCKAKSNGILYTVEKHGYSDPIKIPWPR